MKSIVMESDGNFRVFCALTYSPLSKNTGQNHINDQPQSAQSSSTNHPLNKLQHSREMGVIYFTPTLTVGKIKGGNFCSTLESYFTQGKCKIFDTSEDIYVNLIELRDKILLVDQERKPFDGPLRDNLGTGLAITDQDQIDTINATGFIKHFEDLDLKIEEGGIALSDGQNL